MLSTFHIFLEAAIVFSAVIFDDLSFLFLWGEIM